MIVPCPECGDDALVADCFSLDSTAGPVPYVKLVCRCGHWCTPALEDVVVPVAGVAPIRVRSSGWRDR